MAAAARTLALTLTLSLATLSSAFSTMPVAAADRVMTPGNRAVVDGLAPAPLWLNFAAIASIPRPSRKEEAVQNFMKAFADERGLEWKQDDVGNLVLKFPGRNGGEDAAPVVLQGHVDMVCEKNADTEFDFDTDPIRFTRVSDAQGEWLTAEGTTLGADNGVGCATILALLQDETATLPPLECLFTIDEETGLTGAMGFDPSLISGSTLINLDTEEFGSVYVGCAGGGDSNVFLEGLEREAVPEGYEARTLRVGGLLGGHSGINIHEGRGNALLLAAGTAQKILQAIPGARMATFLGGDKHNALCREADVAMFLPADAVAEAEVIATAAEAAATAEFGLLEKTISVTIATENTAPDAQALTDAAARKLLSTVLALPHGVVKMSAAMADLVETSNNLASVRIEADEDTAKILLNTRSSVPEALEAARDRLEAVINLAGGRFERGVAYPGWNPNMQSPVLGVAKRACVQVTKKEAEVVAIHAGLECGLLGDKKPGLDMVSLGPTVTGAHSPDEQILISTVQPFYEMVRAMLEELAAPVGA
mmetsp:Transcript_28255/g.90384  ORF Transcript_28255/g.90384 Transcript_28255/m.90384 type:complete len:538 (-) Transcript_28255:1754-3367(-)